MRQMSVPGGAERVKGGMVVFVVLAIVIKKASRIRDVWMSDEVVSCLMMGDMKKSKGKSSIYINQVEQHVASDGARNLNLARTVTIRRMKFGNTNQQWISKPEHIRNTLIPFAILGPTCGVL